MLAQYKGINTSVTGNINSGIPNVNEQKYQGSKGVPEDLVKELEQQFGFDKPIHERFIKMVKDYIFFDFGKSYYNTFITGLSNCFAMYIIVIYYLYKFWP